MATKTPSQWHATVFSIFLAGYFSGCSAKVVDLGGVPPEQQGQVPIDAGMPDYEVLQMEFVIGGMALEPGHLYWQAITFNPPPMWSANSTTFFLRSMNLGQDAGAMSSLATATVAGGQDYYPTASNSTPSGLQIDGDWLYWPSHDYATNGDGVSRCSKLNCSAGEFLGNTGPVDSLAVANGIIYWLKTDITNLVTSIYYCDATNCVSSKTQIPMTAPPGAVEFTRSSGLFVDDAYLYTATNSAPGSSNIIRVRKDGTGIFEVIASGSGYSQNFIINGDNVYWPSISADGIPNILSCPKSGCPGQPTLLLSTNLGIDILAADGNNIYFSGYLGHRDDQNRLIYELGRCPLSGCTNPDYLAISYGSFKDILSDEQYIYFASTPEEPNNCQYEYSANDPASCYLPGAFVGRMAKTW